MACRQALASLYEQEGSPGEMCATSPTVTDRLLTNEQLRREPGITTIYGQAGSGKSVLATQISTAKDLNAGNSIMLSYYFSTGDYRTRSYFQLLISFILQILYRGDSSFDSAYVQELHSLMPPPEDMTASHLYRLLCGMLNTMSKLNVICVIDAIDECDEDSRSQLVGDLQRLVVGSPTRYRVFITCRPSDSIVGLLGPLEESNSINLDHHSAEKRTLLLNKELCGSEFAAFRDRLTNDNATPLLIKLVSAMCRMKGIDRVPHHLSDYDDVYEHMLKQMDAPQAWLREVLLCVAFAKRPLTISELAGSMCMAPSSCSILGNNQLTLQKMLIAAPTQLKRDLELACSPLLLIDNGVVRVVHGTLRDFIRKWSCSIFQNEALQDGHMKTSFHMLQKCFNMLSMPELRKMNGRFFKRRPFDTLCEPSIVSQPHMFALYAGSCLAVHVREDVEKDACGENGVAVSVVKDSAAFFLDNQDARDWWIRTFTTLSAATSDITEEHTKLSGPSNFRLFGSMGAWPMMDLMMPNVVHDADKIKLALWDALRQGHTRAARLLLLKADGFSKETWLESLKRCCKYGRADLVSLVLSSWSKSLEPEPEPEPSVADLRSCFDQVAKDGQWHVISTLQEAFPSLTGLIAERETLEMLITQAAKNGWDGVIHELLLLDSRNRQGNVHQEKSQNASEKDYWLSGALVEASKFGSRAVIRLLAPFADLQYGTVPLKSTALHHAALGK